MKITILKIKPYHPFISMKKLINKPKHNANNNEGIS